MPPPLARTLLFLLLYSGSCLLQEEAEQLRQEAQRLSSELKELQLRSLPPQDVVLLDPEVQALVADNRLMMSVAKDQQLKVARAHSMLAASLGRRSRTRCIRGSA